MIIRLENDNIKIMEITLEENILSIYFDREGEN